jgi:hypothetical protein
MAHGGVCAIHDRTTDSWPRLVFFGWEAEATGEGVRAAGMVRSEDIFVEIRPGSNVMLFGKVLQRCEECCGS